ncbi:MAG TPA: hypothetical protein VL588_12240, partial [Bdellovibrionota bacterium]|nr:hypothetical protein [Bdellovibrionota bacterium]
MRQDLAKNQGEGRPRALVLGPLGVARRIAADLEAEGYQSLLPQDVGWEVPLPTSAGAEGKLREALASFAETPGGHVHPGVDPWADRPELSRIGQELGLTVVMPPPKVVSLFANKLSLLAEADRAAVPHLVLGFEPVQSLRETEALMDTLPSEAPVVLKALRGGVGGVGVRVIHDFDELRVALPRWQ